MPLKSNSEHHEDETLAPTPPVCLDTCENEMSFSHVQLVVTPSAVAYQAPPSMGFSRKEYWSALSLPSPGDLPDPGVKPESPALRADALPSEPSGKPFFFLINTLLVSLISIFVGILFHIS